MQTEQEVVAYIGLDWGDQQHRVEVQAVAGGPVDRYELEQRPEALHAWVAQLRRRFHGGPVGIALEQRKGAVIHALMSYEFLVLYPVNPKALARYREVFRTSGAKDDPTDATLLLDLLRHRDLRCPDRAGVRAAPRSRALRQFPRRGPCLRPAPGGRVRDRSRPLGGRHGATSALQHRPGHRTQREGRPGCITGWHVPNSSSRPFTKGGIHLRKQGLESVPRHRRLR